MIINRSKTKLSESKEINRILARDSSAGLPHRANSTL